MNTLSVLIIEDEVVIANDIKEMVEEFGPKVVDICINSKEAIAVLNSKKVDLALVDITIRGGMDGIELAKLINEEYKIPFIFITSHSDDTTVNRAVEQNPYGYVVKPFEKADLYTSIRLCIHKYRALNQNNKIKIETDRLFVKDGNSYFKVKHTDIQFIKASGNYVEISTNEGKYSVRSTFKEVMEDLPKDIFIQIYKSIGININCLESFNSNHAIVAGQELPIGRTFKENLKKLI